VYPFVGKLVCMMNFQSDDHVPLRRTCFYVVCSVNSICIVSFCDLSVSCYVNDLLANQPIKSTNEVASQINDTF